MKTMAAGLGLLVGMVLVTTPSNADEPVRTFGVGVGGGYGWEAIYLTGGGASASATDGAAVYPTVDLHFLNEKQGSWDLSLPIGNTIHAAANGTASVGASLYYRPKYSTGSVRGVLAPGIGFTYVSAGGVSGGSAQFKVRAGFELVGADEHFGVQFLAEPALAAGALSASGTEVGLFGIGITGLVVVSLYQTHEALQKAKSAEGLPSGDGPLQYREAPGADGGLRYREEDRDVEDAIRSIQKHPKFPELGATKPEAKATCEHERGQWTDQGGKVDCKIRGETLFTCDVAADSTMTTCTRYKLGADLADERDSIVETSGKPTSVRPGERGFRVYTWTAPTKTITLTAYPAGVIVTESLAEAKPADVTPSP